MVCFVFISFFYFCNKLHFINSPNSKPINNKFPFTAIISTSYSSTEYPSENLQSNELESIDINSTYRNDLSYKDHYSDMSGGIILSQVSATIEGKSNTFFRMVEI